ncbi:MAG TPA: hypothetical protein DDW91_05480, partial [Shewanella frigidimarina]|nr:hypothetical protein [Shewanella frigidimarina]
MLSGSTNGQAQVTNPQIVTPRDTDSKTESNHDRVVDQSEDEKTNQATKTIAKTEAIDDQKQTQLK